MADPPAANNPERVTEWLPRHVREPLDTYFAFADASVQDIKACARAAGFTGNASQSPLLTYMHIKSRLHGFGWSGREVERDEGHEGLDTIGTVHVADWVAFEHDDLGFLTVYDGDIEKYFQDFAEKISAVFDSVFPHVDGAPPTPVAKNAQAFYQWALDSNYPPIGFYSAYPGLSVLDVRALLADYRTSPPITAG